MNTGDLPATYGMIAGVAGLRAPYLRGGSDSCGMFSVQCLASRFAVCLLKRPVHSPPGRAASKHELCMAAYQRCKLVFQPAVIW